MKIGLSVAVVGIMRCNGTIDALKLLDLDFAKASILPKLQIQKQEMNTFYTEVN